MWLCITAWCFVIMFNAIIGLIWFPFAVSILCVMPQSLERNNESLIQWYLTRIVHATRLKSKNRAYSPSTCTREWDSTLVSILRYESDCIGSTFFFSQAILLLSVLSYMLLTHSLLRCRDYCQNKSRAGSSVGTFSELFCGTGRTRYRPR